MIIADFPYLVTISDFKEIKGGKNNNYYDNRASAVAFSYAQGSGSNSEISVATGTLVYISPGESKAKSFSEAQSLEF